MRSDCSVFVGIPVAGPARWLLTITTPFWLSNADDVYVELTVDCAATTVFDHHGAVANVTRRL